MSNPTYSILAAYKAGHLAQIWQEQTQTMIALSSQFSPLRCGEIIAAKLAKQAEKEYAILEAKCKPIFYLSFEETRLYSWLVNGRYNCLDAQLFAEQKVTGRVDCGKDRIVLLKEELINLSGTQTLIVDMDMLDGKRGNKTYYIIEGFPDEYLLVLEPHDIEPRKITLEMNGEPTPCEPGLPLIATIFEPHDIEPRKIEFQSPYKATYESCALWKSSKLHYTASPMAQLHAYMRKFYANPVWLHHSKWLQQQGQSEWIAELEKRRKGSDKSGNAVCEHDQIRVAEKGKGA